MELQTHRMFRCVYIYISHLQYSNHLLTVDYLVLSQKIPLHYVIHQSGSAEMERSDI